MNIYRRKILWKLALLIAAIIIGVASLVYTSRLVDQLKEEERKKVKHWAEAIQLIEKSEEVEVLNLLSSIIESNNTVPVILCDDNDVIRGFRNFDPARSSDPEYMEEQLARLKARGEPIVINFGDGLNSYIYYNESVILIKLIYYPYIQLFIIVFFIAVAYFAFSMSRRAEQNQVWVGMSKETAHQLGTPTSSLAAWAEIVGERYPGSDLHGELEKDVARLERITERFSRIGSKPELRNEKLMPIIENSIDYLKSRSSSRVSYSLELRCSPELEVPVNASLFEWVLENLFRNSVDAMDGEGEIKVSVACEGKSVIIDTCDTGRGIPKTAYRNIFKPGYSTKSTGWGLGLSLSKRIIEIYHRGKIFVRHSEPGRGTCIRIIIKAG